MNRIETAIAWSSDYKKGFRIDAHVADDRMYVKQIAPEVGKEHVYNGLNRMFWNLYAQENVTHYSICTLPESWMQFAREEIEESECDFESTMALAEIYRDAKATLSEAQEDAA